MRFAVNVTSAKVFQRKKHILVRLEMQRFKRLFLILAFATNYMSLLG